MRSLLLRDYIELALLASSILGVLWCLNQLSFIQWG